MTIKVPNPDGEGEIEVYTPEEITAISQERDTALAEKQKADEALQSLQRHHDDQAGNFKRYKDMSEEEKGKLTDAQVNAMRAAEAAEDRAAKAEAAVNEFRKAESDREKNAILEKYSGGDKELRGKLEEKFDSISGLEDMDERARAAAAILGINVGYQGGFNPLTQAFNGQPPSAPKEKGEKEEFLKSDRAQAAIEAAGGLPTSEDKK